MFSMPGKSYEEPLPALTPDEREMAENLRRHVTAVASVEHNVFKPAELEAAAQYIERELRALRYAVRAQPYQTPLGEVRNIEAELPGRSAELVVVGAHYDSVIGSPGANDNGSGVAAALELARLMRESNVGRTLRFVWFVNEEPPFFTGEDMGSRRYVRALSESGSRVVAMFSLETIGYYDERPGTQRYPPLISALYPGTGNFIAFVANIASRNLLREALGAFRQHARLPSEGAALPAFVPGVDWSDHGSFWEAGYPALMVTDTALYRYPHYHLSSDTPDKLDYERLARVVMGLHAMLREVAAAAP
jgi:Zn-dependent M28 family amino/carboxypeptidase